MTMTYARGEGEGGGYSTNICDQICEKAPYPHFEMHMLQDVYFCNCLCNQIILGWIIITDNIIILIIIIKAETKS